MEEEINIQQNEIPEDTAPKKGKSKMGKIFLVVGILIFQIGVAYFFVESNYAAIKEKVDSFQETGGYTLAIENVIINPSGSNGERYLIFSVVFEFNKSSDLINAESQKNNILDKVSLLLTQKTIPELSDVTKREAFKKELSDELDSLVRKNAVRNLFITKFVIQ